MTATRAALYLRISKDSAKKGLGVARQEADTRAIVAARGWDVAGIYSDNDRSATSKRPRPEYQRMLTDIRAGKIDAVVVYSLERLYRRPEELEADGLLAMAIAGRLRIERQDGFDDLSTADGVYRFRDFINRSSYETSRLSERVSRKMRELAETGAAHGGGTRPMGFADDKVTVIPAERAVIRECVDAILNDGASLRSLCLRLNARGITTPNGNRWRTTPLRRVLTGPRLAGQRTHTVKRSGNGNVVAAQWQAIVTPQEHARIVARLSNTAHRLPAGKHLLSGILYCHVCGTKMISWKSGARRAYICPPPNQGHGCVSIAAPSLEAHVIANATAIRHHEPVIPVLYDTSNERAAIADFVALVGKGTFTNDEITARVAELRAEIAAKDAANDATVTDAERATVGDTLFARWDSLDIDGQRAALAAIVYRVEIRRATKMGRGFNAERVTVILHADRPENIAGIAALEAEYNAERMAR